MFCRNCGSQMEPEAQFCRSCGAKVDRTEQPEPMREPVQNVSSAHNEQTVKTVYVQPTYVAPPPVAQETPKSNDMAIVGFVMAFIMPLVGLILSIIGLKNANKGGDHRGLALAGVVISAIYCAASVLAVVFYFIMFVMMAGIAGGSYYTATLAVGSLLV